MKTNFIQKDLEKVQCPPGKRFVRISDSRVRGLAFRVMSGGMRAFVYYRKMPPNNESAGKVCELTLGKFGDMTIEQARKEAEKLNALVGAGKDPTIGERGEPTYDELFNLYIEQYAKLHTTTWQDAIYNHKRYFERFAFKRISRIKRTEVELWMKDLAEQHGKHTANRNYNTLRAVFSWAQRRNLFHGEHPCLGVRHFKTQARERFLQPGEEFKKFAEALMQEPNETVRDFFWMCLFTGARRANVLAMEWKQINFGLMTWTIPITKNSESQTVPLTPSAMEILRRRYSDEDKHERWVFPSDRKGRVSGELSHLVSPKKAWARLLKRAGIEDLRIHDLRRTAGSYMAIQGVSPTIIGKALGHKSPQATAIYARLTQDPVRTALENAQAALEMPEKLLRKQGNVEQFSRNRPETTKE